MKQKNSDIVQSPGSQNSEKGVFAGLMLAIIIGLTGYGIKSLSESPLVDPLLIAIILGIIGGTVIGKHKRFKPGFVFAPSIFIPVGIGFYAACNLNFVKFAELETGMSALLVVVVLVYFIVIILLGRLLKQRKQITYLTATGSAICGASAIAITSPAVDAKPDDTSISLLSVALISLFGFAVILPFFSALFNITGRTYSLLSGSVLQFTGLVKVAVQNIPYLKTELSEKELLQLALSVKAMRYLGLLVAIPLFASFIKKKLYIPWILWLFLGSGLVGTWIYMNNANYYSFTLLPYIKPIHSISWSIAMAAIGLNADIRELLSNNGTKALVMAFAGFSAATATFFIGLYLIQ